MDNGDGLLNHRHESPRIIRLHSTQPNPLTNTNEHNAATECRWIFHPPYKWKTNENFWEIHGKSRVTKRNEREWSNFDADAFPRQTNTTENVAMENDGN